MSGGLPACISIASASFRAWFSITVTLIVTSGCISMYSSAMVWRSDLPGSLISRCHQSISTGS